MPAKNYLVLNLIKIAMAKNISKIPITIKAIFIRFVIVEVVLFDTLVTLLIDEDVPESEELGALLEEFEFDELLLALEDVLDFEFVFESSVKFKSIP